MSLWKEKMKPEEQCKLDQLLSEIGRAITPGNEAPPGMWNAAFLKNEMYGAAIALCLFTQIEEKDKVCGLWLISAIHKIGRDAGPAVTLPLLLSMLEEAMPKSCSDYRNALADK